MDRKLDQLIQPFDFGMLQDAVTLLKLLKRQGYTSDDFIAYIELQKKAKVRKANPQLKRLIRNSPRCPSCRTLMVLREAHPPDRETGDPGDPGEGSHWTCPRCRFGRYDPRTIQEIRKSIEDDVGQ